MTLPPMRVFVTGATGVIGVHVVRRLAAAGHQVTAVGRTPVKRARLQALGATAVALDLFEAGAARRLLAGHDAVINLATHIPATAVRMLLPWEWRENDRIRREGSAILTSAAHSAGVVRFVQESFAPIHEDGHDDWIDEAWPVRPAPTTRSVCDAEASVARFGEWGGTGVVLRFAGIFGPDPTLRNMLAMVRRGWAPLPGAATAYWSSIAQEDAAAAAVAALGVPAGTYIVCDDEPLTRREFAYACAAAAGARPPRLIPAWLSAIGGESMALLARSQRMRNTKFRAASGWAPRWPSARTGIAAAVQALAAE